MRHKKRGVVASPEVTTSPGNSPEPGQDESKIVEEKCKKRKKKKKKTKTMPIKSNTNLLSIETPKNKHGEITTTRPFFATIEFSTFEAFEIT